jgi:hypothetical protein
MQLSMNGKATPSTPNSTVRQLSMKTTKPEAIFVTLSRCRWPDPQELVILQPDMWLYE